MNTENTAVPPVPCDESKHFKLVEDGAIFSMGNDVLCFDAMELSGNDYSENYTYSEITITKCTGDGCKSDKEIGEWLEMHSAIFS